VTDRTAYRIRGAASIARPGRIWAAAVLMNAPVIVGACILGWYAFSAYEPGLKAVAGVLFALAAFWAVLVTLASARVLRRFVRRGAGSTTSAR
jgi:hypothetical protein